MHMHPTDSEDVPPPNKFLDTHNMNNNLPNHHRNFTGSIDEFLNHVDKINADAVAHELTDNVPLTDEEHIDTIMADCSCSKEDAAVILEEMKQFQVAEMVETLVSEGLLEVKSYDENGEPRYGHTELGQVACEEEKKRREKKNE